MMWYCGGHGTCLTSPGPGGYVERAIVGWFDRHLKGDESVVTGPRFEWLAEDGVWRTAADYPLRDAGALTGTGSGPLPVTPVDYALSGGLLNGTVAPIAIEARVPASAGADVVGTPQLDLTYTGTAVPAQTFLYAQVVDPARDIVVGNQVTPLPVTLDGRERAVSRPLEGLSSRPAASGYVVQVIGGSNVYGPQRSVGGITSSRLAVTLPTVDAAATPDDVSGPGLPAPPAPPPAAGQRRVRIALAGPGGRASRRGRVLRVRVGTSDRLSDLTLVLRDERGRRMGRGTRASLSGRRVVRVLLSRRLRAGTYRLTAVASARDGSRVTATRSLRFR
jgi:ABC-2 type transport system ATP-binding protein